MFMHLFMSHVKNNFFSPSRCSHLDYWPHQFEVSLPASWQITATLQSYCLDVVSLNCNKNTYSQKNIYRLETLEMTRDVRNDNYTRRRALGIVLGIFFAKKTLHKPDFVVKS